MANFRGTLIDVESPNALPPNNSGASIFLLDDLRSFKPEVLKMLEADSYVRVCRSSESAIQALEADDRCWNQFWFDHDLGMIAGVEDSSMTVVKYILSRHEQGRPLKVNSYVIHSSNVAGVKNIALALQSIGEATVIVNPSHYFIVH